MEQREAIRQGIGEYSLTTHQSPHEFLPNNPAQ